MKYYKVSEDDLLDMLAARIELGALNVAGVDNWQWYGEGFSEIRKEYGDHCEDFEDCAAVVMKGYEEVE